jgi:predicted nucleic acid-binding protein
VNEKALVDSSIWVNHFRSSNLRLIELLEEGRVVTHPFIIGELACGNMKNRVEILELLGALPSCTVADFDEINTFIDKNRLMGKGLGFVDMHLLAAAILTDFCIWTDDKSLAIAAKDLGISFKTA